MSTNTELTILEQQEVFFYEDNLTAVRASDGSVYAALTQMCDALGIDAQAQRRRIGRHAVLSGGLQRVAMMATPHGDQSAYVLRSDLIALWLSGIQASRVNDALRPKLIQFQTNAARVLNEAFKNGELSFDDNFSELLAQGGDAVEAYQMLQGMLKLAKNQILLQSSVRDNSNRISALESQLSSPNRLITSEQSMHVSQAVKTIALEMGKRSGRNEFQGVYGELYRRFKIPSYRELPATQYDEAMNFLRDWYSSVIGGDVPF